MLAYELINLEGCIAKHCVKFPHIAFGNVAGTLVIAVSCEKFLPCCLGQVNKAAVGGNSVARLFA